MRAPLQATTDGRILFVTATADGLRMDEARRLRRKDYYWGPSASDTWQGVPSLVQALRLRGRESGLPQKIYLFPPPRVETRKLMDRFAAEVLVLPRNERWREALSTALLGDWCEPLLRTGRLPDTALGALKAEARAVHRQLMPVWRRRTRHGRVLSLDADLGGLSLYELVSVEVDYLAHTAGGVFEDERLNRVLRGLDQAERQVVFAYAEGLGTSWAEAAASVGVAEPEAFGERVRRKVHRLVGEQRRRAAQRCPRSPAT
ncbi:hypothetical protein B446_35678 (plasmid) [Streptomyces collinus Tu 365]|uniref:Uncharacterized protein n=1 Tax=Streptomyces collinus (strain DSM 40733 / Tue 365) TaxID=1214242 RepID=S5VFA5_STRC3|nr:hypothetical protein [Streptomyces collinus]AGS73894.1 hypothetical protein B446_35678 [Streptomyces collinus Tu 365]